MSKKFKAAKGVENLTPEEYGAMIQALKTVSFYARINHGTKCKDYGEIVDPVLRMFGLPTGEL